MLAQVHNAKELLKSAVKKEHGSTTLVDQFICETAYAMIDLGLNKRLSHGFELQCVALAHINQALLPLKKQNNLTMGVAVIIKQLSLHQYFTTTVSGQGEKLLAANMPVLLMQPCTAVKQLLPVIAWQRSSKTSSQTSHCIAIESNAATSTASKQGALVLDQDLSQSTGDTQKLHIIQVDISNAITLYGILVSILNASN